MVMAVICRSPPLPLLAPSCPANPLNDRFAEDFICVQTPPPGPTQSGIPADCNKWVLQQDGVYCQGMANNAGISLTCLYQMNPALNTDKGECQGLWAGEAYCVGTASNVCTS